MSVMRILAGWLIDGRGRPVRKNIYLESVDGRFVAIRDISAEDFRLPGVVDLTGYTVLPPFVDCHVHLCMSGTVNPVVRSRQLEAPNGEVEETICNHIRAHMRHGILAVRDGGDRRALTLKYRSSHHDDESFFYIRAAGQALHQKGRYGGFIGRYLPAGISLADYIRNEMSDARDHIKIINSGLNSLKRFGAQTPPQFLAEALTAAVKQAQKKGLLVMVHANGDIPVRISIESGCASIEHGFFMGPDNLRRMERSGTCWVPTACTMQALAEGMPSDSPQAGMARLNWQHQVDQIKAAGALGVKIALGTDSGSPGVNHGEALINELKILLHAGYSLEAAIQCATYNGWQLLGVDDIGAITERKQATFMAVKARPDRLLEEINQCRLYVNAKKVQLSADEISLNGSMPDYG